MSLIEHPALHGALDGRYVLRKYSSGGVLLEEYHTKNIITNTGLDLLGTATPYSAFGKNNGCYVGSGSTTPSATDTALSAYVATSSTVNAVDGVHYAMAGTGTSGDPYYGARGWTWRFNPGVATGNLSEVGIGATSTSLASRALIRDGSGNPITITILADEYLDVTYIIRSYLPVNDITGSVVIGGVTYTYITRPSNAGDGNANSYPGWRNRLYVRGAYAVINNGGGVGAVYAGTIGAVTGVPSGTNSSTSSNVTDSAPSYVAGSFSQQSTTTYALNGGNITGGIRSMVYSTGLSQWQTQFTPAIPKDATKILTLTHQVTWGRYAP